MVLVDDPQADVPAVRCLENSVVRDIPEKLLPRRARVL